uniref:Uncharacterized protein n=1 Tax=Cucumis melo TaxID=3656 RepID=A0A9I9DTW7_CUCME
MLWEQREHFNKAEKIVLSAMKCKVKKKTIEEYCKELEKEIDESSPLEDEEVVKP